MNISAFNGYGTTEYLFTDTTSTSRTISDIKSKWTTQAGTTMNSAGMYNIAYPADYTDEFSTNYFTMMFYPLVPSSSSSVYATTFTITKIWLQKL